MNDKYFVPDISDLRVGYILEVFRYLSGKYEKEIIDQDLLSELLTDDSYTLRTSYLTKEQIEEEGWIAHAISKNIYYREDCKDKGILYLTKEDDYIVIEDDRDGVFLFRGECKSINELRYIIKLLKI